MFTLLLLAGMVVLVIYVYRQTSRKDSPPPEIPRSTRPPSTDAPCRYPGTRQDEETRSQQQMEVLQVAELKRKLLRKVMGDQERADSLIAFERSRCPSISELEATRAAIWQLERDNRSWR